MTALPKIPRTAPDMVRRVYDAAAKRNKRTRPKVRVSVGDLGVCERDIWAAIAGVPNERPFGGQVSVHALEVGKVLEPFIVDLLTQADYEVLTLDPETGQQFEVSAFDGKLIGYLDGKVKMNGTWRVLEIKTCSAKQFALFKSLSWASWNPKYHCQVQGYMGLSSIDDSVCVVFNRDRVPREDGILIEKVRFDPDFFSELLDKAERVLNQPPDVPLPRPIWYEEDERGEKVKRGATSQYCGFCKWCPRNQWCWSATADVRFAE